ncbi:hypothetical protein Flavo103_05710 [Flavobacterium collinsii]|uniref:hypothetical protein n=1 Tax=Flavobacterium collinsii TaxID=1114861 RepID=UPI0022C798A6|nr:hypothetical protein [Flavobacterium collinsii]GIQ57435.1 hypothetical protein Flavo103_05710 [Flavobacterium collinsii]
MKNIKKMAILLMVLGVAVLTGRCVSEEAGSEQKIEQSITVSQARVWFEQYQSKVKIDSSFKSQVYNWDSAITETFENGTEALVVPVRDNNLSDAYKGQKVLYLYPLENKNDFSATLYEILPLSESLEKIKSSADLVNFNGYIIAWDLERGFVNGAKFENSNTTAALTGLRVISSEESERLNKSTAKSDPFELDEVIIRREKSENKQDYGGGGSAGGSYGGSLNSGSKGNSPKGYVKSPGGGGSSSSTGSTVTKVIPPSCESFNFTSKKGANWQEAVVKNVQFKIVLLTPPNKVQITHVINYPQSISFGMPINYNKGNGDVTSGVAATVSAKVLQLVMDDVVKKYGRTEASEVTVSMYFRQKLIDEYREYTNGGIVNFNSTSNIKATEYKTSLFGTGNCD